MNQRIPPAHPTPAPNTPTHPQRPFDTSPLGWQREHIPESLGPPWCGVAWGVVGVAIVIALTFIGSVPLVWFDAALVGYLVGVVFAVSASPTATRSGYAARKRRCSTVAVGMRSVSARSATPPRYRRWSPPSCSPRGSSAVGRVHVGWPTSCVPGCILAGLVTIPLNRDGHVGELTEVFKVGQYTAKTRLGGH